MDQFIEAAKLLAEQLLPTFSFIVLVMIIILWKKFMTCIDSLTSVVLKTKHTIDLVDDSITKVQAPLDTAVRLSGSVDKMHEAGIKVAKDAADYVSKNSKEIKDKVNNVLTSKSSEIEQ